MIALALVPLAVTIFARFAAGAIARRCSPATAVRCLAGLALSAAVGTGLALSVLAGIGDMQVPYVGRVGGWSAHVLSDHVPVPEPVAVALSVTAVGLLIAAACHAVRSACRLARAASLCRTLDPHGAGFVVVDDDRVGACALPGRPGRIVVSRNLLRGLTPDERRAVLAHETAHLRHGHAGYVQAVELAAAANPLLKPVVAAVRLAVETWADEAAADVVGDRSCVARALAKASLATRSANGTRSGWAAPALGMAADSDIAARIGHLLDEPYRRRGTASLGAVAIAASVLSTGTAFVAALWAHGLFELAEFRR